MGGCSVRGDTCGVPLADPPSNEEKNNCKLVEKFIKQVWNHGWTAAENQQFRQHRLQNNRNFVPPAVVAALAQFCSAATIRHRRDAAGNPIMSTGPNDYENCINLVHEVTPDLHIDILHIMGQGDRVFAQIKVSGTHTRLDPAPGVPGAFGMPDTGRRFELQTATLYRIENDRIAEDWLLYGAEPTFQ